jgi:hypothetical protein
MQGPQINTLTQTDEVNTFTKKSELWKETEITFLICFLLLKDIVPAMKQKLTKIFHLSLGYFAEKKKKIQCILN